MSEHSHGKVVLDDVIPLGRALRPLIPDVYRGYAELNTAAMKAGAVDAKTKELIALAVSVTLRCDGCINAHTDAAIKAGATKEEVVDALGVAIMVNAGAAMVYSARTVDAFDAKSG